MKPSSPDPAAAPRVLLFEPRIEGHHLPWLRMMTEDLLSGGIPLCLAVRQDDEARRAISSQMGDLLPRVKALSITGAADEPNAQVQLRRAAELLDQSGADTVFFCCLDEVTSSCLRRAAFGFMPPRRLRGNFGGTFLRPRFLTSGTHSLNIALKGIGFRRLARQRWFRQVLFCDEHLCARAVAQMPGAPFFPLADPPTQVFDQPREAARVALGLPQNKRIFLFYGGPYRRKGLHLALEAMLELPADHPSFLLCAGRQPAEADIGPNLARLASQGRALAINRYISPEEEKAVFGACDLVLLPYIHHFGSSGVLALAAAAGKPVIASDEDLVGARVREYDLGWLFPTGDVTRLRQAIDEAARSSAADLQRRAAGAAAYARKFSRAAFRQGLLKSFGLDSP